MKDIRRDLETSIIVELRKKLLELTNKAPKRGKDLKESVENLQIWLKEFNMLLDILYLNFLGPKKRLEQEYVEQVPSLDPLQLDIKPRVRVMTPEFEDALNQYTAFSTLYIEQARKALNLIEKHISSMLADVGKTEQAVSNLSLIIPETNE